jgi:phage terminase large subunit-like protein
MLARVVAAAVVPRSAAVFLEHLSRDGDLRHLEDDIASVAHHAAQVQAGNVLLLAGEWNRAFLDEHETFPAGKFKDQVDAASGAFNKLATASSYDSSYSGWN